MRRLSFAAAAAALTLSLAPTSFAQAATPADYTEQKVDSGQAVIFHDDALKAGGLETTGYVIRARGSFWRTGLIRPRLNFVPELVKSADGV
jgi:hypothetical protein